ncbi:helix-turn-helix domain-containing protein [Hymenobacter defluvii]|uniref:Helix-turn-helix domain-containing protein n=1 Tax=Hymenobacter defluvii TaxID=2054411 RepID=A0ABS3THH9_9BACT|nr:helix-turn-helix domain-containing protein [Hymenobacter defluvii]MBO3273129.1 helix-turn-helix domain-containing protein [Hymenobacter defluvii]
MDNPFEVLDKRLRNLEALMQEILQHLRAGAPVAEPMIGGIELAQEITRLSKARIYALVSARQIPHAKRGNKLYFTRNELQTWIAVGNRTPYP